MALDHYVSQVHLKRFYSPALGELFYAMRKSDLKRFTPKAKDVCRLDEGSTNSYLVEPRAIEEFLKTVENRYNAAVSAFETGKPDQVAIYVLAGFVSYLLSCSPAAMRINSGPLKAGLEASAKIVDAMGQFPLPPPALGGKYLSELLESGNVRVEVDPKYSQAIGVANILQRVATFGNFQWDVLINEHSDCPFFTSDFPVANEQTHDRRLIDRIVPLTPTTAVRIHPNIDLQHDATTYEFEKFSCKRRKLSRQEAVKINRLLVQSAEDTVFFRDDQPWVPGFIQKNRHFRIETETIELPHGRGVLQWSRQAVKPFQQDVL